MGSITLFGAGTMGSALTTLLGDGGHAIHTVGRGDGATVEDDIVIPAVPYEELQRALPDSRVVKAFNVNFAATLSGKRVGPNTTTVLVAGDEDAAKQSVIELARASGVEALDAGSLARARELESLGFLQIALANSEQIDWSAGFGLVA